MSGRADVSARMRVNCLILRRDTLLMLVEANTGSSFQVRVEVFANGGYWPIAAIREGRLSAKSSHSLNLVKWLFQTASDTKLPLADGGLSGPWLGQLC